MKPKRSVVPSQQILCCERHHQHCKKLYPRGKTLGKIWVNPMHIWELFSSFPEFPNILKSSHPKSRGDAQAINNLRAMRLIFEKSTATSTATHIKFNFTHFASHFSHFASHFAHFASHFAHFAHFAFHFTHFTPYFTHSTPYFGNFTSHFAQ
jgi:hypothetical protein